MTDEKQTPEQVPGETGIFEPKALPADRIPVSGTVRAVRLAVFLAMIVIGVLIWLALRDPFMKPVRRYYKGLTKGDPAAMAEAFPGWLVDADTDENTVSVTDMCAAIVSATKFYYGEGAKAKANLVSQQEVDAAYLERIAQGIRTQYHYDVEIKRGVWITMEVLYTSPDGAERRRTEYARIYQINGTWCLLDIPSETQ